MKRFIIFTVIVYNVMKDADSSSITRAFTRMWYRAIRPYKDLQVGDKAIVKLYSWSKDAHSPYACQTLFKFYGPAQVMLRIISDVRSPSYRIWVNGIYRTEKMPLIITSKEFQI